jgi:hypothetical protein
MVVVVVVVEREDKTEDKTSYKARLNSVSSLV